MSENSVRVVARIVALPGKADELRAVLTRLIEPTRGEPGCVRYELLQNQADPTDFTFVEEWESDAAFKAHIATNHFKETAGRLPPLVAAEPDIRRYTVVG